MKRWFHSGKSPGLLWEWDLDTQTARWVYERTGKLREPSGLTLGRFLHAHRSDSEVFPLWGDPCMQLPEGL